MIETLGAKLTLAQQYFETSEGQSLGFQTEWDGNKFYLIEPAKAQLCDFDLGRTYTLEKNGDPQDWYYFKLLYLAGWESKKFRTDVPIKQEIVTLNGDSWQYTTAMRPGGNHGEFVMTLEDSEEYFETLLESYFNLLSAAKEIADANNVGVPSFTGRMIKDSDGYYFVKDYTSWNDTVQNAIKNTLRYHRLFKLDYQRNLLHYTDWLDRARNKWGALA